MPTCFVIQPFDNGKFDQRYKDVYEPAIGAAGFEPYRVDGDPTASVLIDAIEQGIRDAQVCLADITEDNPNVWYELGFALASGKEVCMVCSSERTGKFPFDIQHRSILTFKPHSLSDFTKLQTRITEKMTALLDKQQRLHSLAA